MKTKRRMFSFAISVPSIAILITACCELRKFINSNVLARKSIQTDIILIYYFSNFNANYYKYIVFYESVYNIANGPGVKPRRRFKNTSIPLIHKFTISWCSYKGVAWELPKIQVIEFKFEGNMLNLYWKVFHCIYDSRLDISFSDELSKYLWKAKFNDLDWICWFQESHKGKPESLSPEVTPRRTWRFLEHNRNRVEFEK